MPLSTTRLADRTPVFGRPRVRRCSSSAFFETRHRPHSSTAKPDFATQRGAGTGINWLLGRLGK